MYDKREFRDSTGRWRTQSLFAEKISRKSRESGLEPVYCLHAGHPSGLPCLKELYMECEDPTEYEFADNFLGGWDHWERLLENKWFQEYAEQWRRELEIKIRSRNIRHLSDIALSGTGHAVQAAKWLAEGKWKQTRRGRPTKAEKQKEQEIEKRATDSMGEDAERVFGVIDGGKKGK